MSARSIDGVLYKGHRGIPGAREVLRRLRAGGIRYVFLTNGGGAHEDAKARSLARRLQMSDGDDVIGGRVIVSHTPMRGWADAVKERTVLITGSQPETARELANERVPPPPVCDAGARAAADGWRRTPGTASSGP